MKKYLLVLTMLLFIPSVSLASFDVSLKYGSRGDAVVELQDFLTDQGVYTGKLDGRFGFGTLKAVKAFQTANSLSADGYFGKGSRAKANELLTAELAPSDAAEQAETGTISAPVVQPKPTPAPIPVTITNPTLPAPTQTPAPIINVTPTSMKDLQIENLTQGDVYYFKDGVYGSFKFKITVLDDNGNIIPSPKLSMQVDNASSSSYFGGYAGSTGETEYSPNKVGDVTLTFGYAPLNLTKSITVTAK